MILSFRKMKEKKSIHLYFLFFTIYIIFSLNAPMINIVLSNTDIIYSIEEQSYNMKYILDILKGYFDVIIS